jgi:AcrR family transcriptional regulator
MSSLQLKSKSSQPARQSKQASPWGARRKRRDTQFPEKREALFTAAARLFRERGYDGTSLNDLAETLNITKPTLYYYVQSKDQLVLEIIRRAQSEMLRAMQEIELGAGTAYDKLRAIMIQYVLLMVSDNGACLALLNTREFETKTQAEVVKRIAEGDEILYRVLVSGQKDGSIAEADRITTLHALFGSLNWLPRWYKPEGRLPPQKFARLFVDILLEGVRPRGKTAR